MSKSNPQPGDVFMNTSGSPRPFPILVVKTEHGPTGVLISGDGYVGDFTEWTTMESLQEKNGRYKYLFKFSAKDLEEIIVQRYNNGDFNNVSQD